MHRAGADEGRYPPAVIEGYLDGTVAAVVLAQPFAGYRDVAVNSYRVLAISPYRDERTTSQRAYAGLSVYRQQGGGQCTVDGVSTGISDFTGRISRELRRGCDSDSGHVLEVNHRADALTLMHEIKCTVNVFERHRVSNKLVDLDTAIHVLVDHAG